MSIAQPDIAGKRIITVQDILRRILKAMLSDPTFWSLLVANLIVIYAFFSGQIGLSTLLWSYWTQSMIIGFFTFIGIRKLKDFDTTGFKINGQSVQPTDDVKKRTAGIFLVIYGAFHLGYAVFLLEGGFGFFTRVVVPTDIRFVLFSAGIFFVNHLFSFLYNAKWKQPGQNIGTVMFTPLLRIIPMQFVIVIGTAFAVGAFFLFIILKMITDLLMHVVENSERLNKSTSSLPSLQ